MKFRLLAALILLPALTGCGNPDRGLSSATKKATATAKFDTCYNLNVSSAAAGSFGQSLQGASVCPATNEPGLVRLRVPASFPANSRVCLVPFAANAAGGASCTSVTGQADFVMSMTGFNSLSVVRESDVTTYRTYLSGLTASPPSYGYASWR